MDLNLYAKERNEISYLGCFMELNKCGKSQEKRIRMLKDEADSFFGQISRVGKSKEFKPKFKESRYIFSKISPMKVVP